MEESFTRGEDDTVLHLLKTHFPDCETDSPSIDNNDVESFPSALNWEISSLRVDVEEGHLLVYFNLVVHWIYTAVLRPMFCYGAVPW